VTSDPLIRSARVRAATTTSKAATLPMLVCERPVQHPPHNLTQPGTIGYVGEVDRQAVSKAHSGRPD
jgi:hypothetical protein